MSWLIPTPRHYPGIAIFLNAAKATSLEFGYTITYAVSKPLLIIWGVVIVQMMK